MDCIVLGVAKSQTGLSDFHFQVSSDIQNSMGDASKSHLPYQPAAGEKEEREKALIEENSRRNTKYYEKVFVLVLFFFFFLLNLYNLWVQVYVSYDSILPKVEI